MKSCLDYLEIGKLIPFPEVWTKVMTEWGAVLEEYMQNGQDMNEWVVREQGGDLPYWHSKEATNIGFLAAAVWRLGGVCLQEYEVTRPERSGEADLWFKLDRLSCQVEAKGTNSPSVLRDSVVEGLNEARYQLQIPTDERADLGMALCFAVPAVAGSFYDFRTLAHQFDGERELVAVYLPRRSMSYDGYQYPGIALIGQLAWHSSKESSEILRHDTSF